MRFIDLTHRTFGRLYVLGRAENNLLGYTTSNVVSCCEVCNKAKRTMGYGAFIAYWIKAGSFQARKVHSVGVGA